MSDLSAGWKTEAIGDVCDIHDSRRIPLSSEQRRERKGPYPYYGANNIQDSIDDFIFDFDAVLLAEDGGYYDEYETRDIAQYATGKYWVNNHAHILTGKEYVDTKFLYYSLVRKNICPWINTGTRAKLNQADLRQIEIEIPPLPEQKKIAEILSGVDWQVINLKTKLQKQEYLQKGIINYLMKNGTRGGKVTESDAGWIPENWKVGQVDDFFTLGRGRVISIPYIKENPGPYPVFSSQSKNNGEMGRMNSYDFDGEYFTWTTDGAYAGSVFARCGKFNCTNVCGTAKAKFPEEASSKFAAYFLQRVAKNHVSYVGNPKLMNNTFSEIPFALPPIKEQIEIITIIDSIESKICGINAKIQTLLNLKTAISSDLLSGRKRVST